jgi:hypothetical protein
MARKDEKAVPATASSVIERNTKSSLFLILMVILNISLPPYLVSLFKESGHDTAEAVSFMVGLSMAAVPHDP